MRVSSENADKEFHENLRKVVDYMGDERTTMDELEQGGNHFLGSFLRGVYPMDEQPPPDGTHHAVIVNVARTAVESMSKGHWIALLRHGEEEVIYDSFGRDPVDFAPSLANLETTERDAEQPLDVEWCGQACIATCMICKEHGLELARLV
jgi:hypothetical protein|eukprot:COSAG06_NODE_6700_length_2820_cov_17.488056_1_plen_150_part_00